MCESEGVQPSVKGLQGGYPGGGSRLALGWVVKVHSAPVHRYYSNTFFVYTSLWWK